MRIFSWLLPFFCLTFFVGCSKKEEGRCEVLVSIPPYLYFVDALSGGELTACSLVPPEANPHLYEPTPKQVKLAQKAKVWVRVSELFEKKIAVSLREHNASLVSVNLGDSKELSYIYENGHAHSCKHCHYGRDSKDLHIWLSLRMGKVQAELIAQALIQAFPEKKLTIEQNLSVLVNRFEKLDEEFSQKLAPYKGESILISHPALGYFCRDYDLHQISIETEGKDPLPQQLASILASAKANTIRTVFTQRQYNNKGAEIIAKDLHMIPHEIDPYSADYLKNLELIVQAIVEP